MNPNVKQRLVYKVFNDDASIVPFTQHRYENTGQWETTISDYVLCEIYGLVFPVNGIILLKWMYENGLDSLGYEPLEGSCEHGNKLSGSVKDWEIS
jgi:hypothetical protein